jgi:hypothetical protein
MLTFLRRSRPSIDIRNPVSALIGTAKINAAQKGNKEMQAFFGDQSKQASLCMSCLVRWYKNKLRRMPKSRTVIEVIALDSSENGESPQKVNSVGNHKSIKKQGFNLLHSLTSIRVIMSVFIMILVVAVGVAVWRISLSQSEVATNELARQFVDALTGRIAGQVTTFLKEPCEASPLFLELVRRGVPLSILQSYMLRMMQTYKSMVRRLVHPYVQQSFALEVHRSDMDQWAVPGIH